MENAFDMLMIEGYKNQLSMLINDVQLLYWRKYERLYPNHLKCFNDKRPSSWHDFMNFVWEREGPPVVCAEMFDLLSGDHMHSIGLHSDEVWTAIENTPFKREDTREAFRRMHRLRWAEVAP